MRNISKGITVLLLATASILTPKESISQIVSKEVCDIFQEYARTNKESGFYQAFQEVKFSEQQKQKILDEVCSMSEQEILARSFILPEIIKDSSIPMNIKPAFIASCMGAVKSPVGYKEKSEFYYKKMWDKAEELDKIRPQLMTEAKKGLAESYKGLAEAYKGLAEAEKGLAESYKGLAESYKGLGELEKGLAEEKKGLAEEKKGLAEEKKGLAEEKKGLAEEKKGLAEIKGLAEEKKGLAEEIKGLAEEKKGLSKENNTLKLLNNLGIK